MQVPRRFPKSSRALRARHQPQLVQTLEVVDGEGEGQNQVQRCVHQTATDKNQPEQDILAAVQALKEPCCARGVDEQAFETCQRAMAAEWQHAEGVVTIYAAYGRRSAP